MSKYIKVKDIKNALIELVGSGKRLERKTTTNIIKALNNLQTIEVNEGVIGQGSGDIDWQAVTSTGQEIYVKGYGDGRKSVEVSEGEWIFEEYPDGHYYSECSICKHWFIEDAFLKPYNYCPNCGVKMRGAE